MRSFKYVIYRNKRFGFTLKIPSWWKKHCYLSYENVFEDAKYSLNFNLRYTKPYSGKKSSNIFSILVFNMSKKEWMKKYNDSPVGFIAEHKGNVFASINPEEPPEEFLNKKTGDYNRSILEFKWLYHMENVELPLILKSMRFI